MDQFLHRLTIQQKIRFGFGVIWFALALITIQAAVNLFLVREKVSEVIEQKQPLAIEAQSISFELEKGMNALSMFLATGEDKNLEFYNSSVQGAAKTIESRLSGDADKVDLAEDSEIAGSYRRLQTLLESLPSHIAEIQKVQSQPSLKFPGFAYVDENMNPKAIRMQQILSEMLDSELVEYSQNRRQLLGRLIELQKTWLNVMSSVRGYMAFRNDSMQKMTENYLGYFDQQLSDLNQQADSQNLTLEEESGLENLTELSKEYLQNYHELRNIHESPKWRMDLWIAQNQIEPIFREMENELNQISSASVAEMKQLSGDVIDSSWNNIVLLLLLSITGQLVGMLISRRVTRSVIEPIKTVSHAMRDISEGEGDLTRRLPVNSADEMGEMARYFNDFMEKIRQMLKEVALTVDELDLSSKRLLDITHDARLGSQQQRSATEDLSNSVMAMRQKAASVEDHSRNTTRATDQATDRVKQSGEMVGVAAEEIEKLSQGMRAMNESVVQLRADSELIGTVVSVIKEIAEQTNLLSLNAAIEAARAGEHGRGFAVVADEVRGLAQRTQESTVEIEAIIDKIRSATLSTVSVVEASKAATKSSCEAVMKTRDTLQPVSVLMDDIQKMSEQVLSAAQSQSQLAETVKQHILQIHEVSEETVARSENTERYGDGLKGLADQLETLVKQFRI
ncbi:MULTISPECIES: methyl-accepting chemotaxis protein [Thiomicrorhabdus]|uniref:Methyl-accepting chemotaxis protein n=1 Tax=Thiomicrorhabdus heinhorstiae TaxID=2748010 RepID=A0ABS0C0F3_9GAMM|nr:MULTISPECIES: methyl-accepting chemotaxis protein [Thiomicrorhabdus]MBF6058566.1 methyl-accepting chemotaxis protein [Thiomicrorhabdus heinhorstiae]